MRHVYLSYLYGCVQTVVVQLAAYADHQLCVRKALDLDGRVNTHIAALKSHQEEVAAVAGEYHGPVFWANPGHLCIQ